MSNYEIGYGKPPVHTRFKKGVCPNPAGRGKRQASPLRDTADRILQSTVRVERNGKSKRCTYAELIVEKFVLSALAGDARAAKRLLELRRHGMVHGRGPRKILIRGGLPVRVPEP